MGERARRGRSRRRPRRWLRFEKSLTNNNRLEVTVPLNQAEFYFRLRKP